jgi:quinolinate synthase
MAKNTLEKIRDCMLHGRPEITWQPEFDRARDVLERSLLQTGGGKPAAPLPVGD